MNKNLIQPPPWETDEDPLQEENRATKIMGDEFDEEEIEEEEIAPGEKHDVITNTEPKIAATSDEIPRGMETAVREEAEEDENVVEEAGEDLETGED